MPQISFQDFFLTIGRKGSDGLYTAATQRAAGGDASVTFSPAEIRAGLRAVEGDSAAGEFELDVEGAGQVIVVESRPPEKDAAKDLGRALFRAVFKDDLATVLRQSREAAQRAGQWLRLRLNLSDAPELAVLPWEFIFDDHFLARSNDTPVVRYLNSIRELPPTLAVEGPLRMLVMAANLPQAPLNVEQEWENLKEALKDYEKEGLLKIERLDGGSVAALETRLAEAKLDQPFHVFHFIGHAAYDRRSAEGYLVVTDEGETRARALSAARLSEILGGHKETLRLVVLNACEGARSAETDSYAGLAQSLIRQGGIPAVVAMQYKITDRAALRFSRQFYGTLAVGYPVETAITYARRALDDDARAELAEWATPVLYLRAADGRLFRTRPSRIPPPAPHIPPAMAGHYKAVVEQLKKGKLVPFVGLDANLYGRLPDPAWEPGAHLPCNSELAAYLKREFKYPDGEILDPVSISQYAFVTDRRTLGRVYERLSDVFIHAQEPTPLHHFISRLPKLLREAGYPKVSIAKQDQQFLIATTTYDRLLEHAFADVMPYHVVSYVIVGEQPGRFWHAKYAQSGELLLEPEEIRDPPKYTRLLNDPDPVILKLPGAVEMYEQRFAITEDHYADYLTHRNLSELLPPQIKGKLKSSSHLFLGSTLRNWHLRALLYRVWEDRKASSPGWAVHPAPLPIDQEYWQLSNVTSVRSDYEEYVAGLGETLARHLSAAV